MGCGGSKDDVMSQPGEFKEIKDARPEAIRKEINELYKFYLAKREELRPLLLEKYGLNDCLDKERENLLVLLAKKEDLMSERTPLMQFIWEHDAEEIHKAFQRYSLDKETLFKILCARSKWQVSLISEIYERKHGISLLDQCVNELTTLVGKITGSGTGLSKLLIYRIMDQPSRDAAFLRDFTDGIGLEDENLLEILCTRTNAELRAAMDAYAKEYKKQLPDIVRSKASQKNYRDFLLRILECQKDETYRPLDPMTAQMYANQLYAAGAARTIGIDAAPFIGILATANNRIFESINEFYKDKRLLQDITYKLGGDFQQAVLTQCSDKFEYLAKRLNEAFKGFSINNETIGRIIGCISRPECLKLKQAYNRMYSTEKSLEEQIRYNFKSQVSYQSALLLLLSEDDSLTPLGHDKETHEIEMEIEFEAERGKDGVIAAYSVEIMQKRGEPFLQAREKKLRSKENEDEIEDSEYDTEENQAINFHWDAKAAIFVTNAGKLTAKYRACEQAVKATMLLLERLGDEINAIKDVYASIVKHRFETEAWIRYLNSDIKHLNTFIEQRMRDGPRSHSNDRPISTGSNGNATIVKSNSQVGLNGNNNNNHMIMKSNSTLAATPTKPKG